MRKKGILQAIFPVSKIPFRRFVISGGEKIHGLHTVAVHHAQTVAMNILGYDQNYERQVNVNSLKELDFEVIVAGELVGEEIRYKHRRVLRKMYLLDNRINGFVLVGDISNAGYFLSMLKERKPFPELKPEILDPHYSLARRVTRRH